MDKKIKFRVIKDNKIVAFEELVRNCWQWCYAENGKPNNKMQAGTSFYNDCERQHFVNLYDINENEIYNGDILLVEPLGYRDEFKNTESYRKYISIVEWELHPERVRFDNEKVGGFREWRLKPFYHSYESIKIIGNINENDFEKLVAQHSI